MVRAFPVLQWSVELTVLSTGELLTFGPPDILASDFTGAVLAINGDADLYVHEFPFAFCMLISCQRVLLQRLQ